MTMAQTVLMLAFSVLSIVTTYYVISMVKKEEAKAKEYEAMKAIRDKEHAEFINTYYREREESHAKFEKELEDSWKELADSLKELMKIENSVNS